MDTDRLFSFGWSTFFVVAIPSLWFAFASNGSHLHSASRFHTHVTPAHSVTLYCDNSDSEFIVDRCDLFLCVSYTDSPSRLLNLVSKPSVADVAPISNWIFAVLRQRLLMPRLLARIPDFLAS
jgi:hypothetical protein